VALDLPGDGVGDEAGDDDRGCHSEEDAAAAPRRDWERG
jgi:hypothetical protein